MASDAVDRLSDLPDDLLRRVLHCTPTKEAASTTALSRRWRPLWPTLTTIVSLDSRSHDATHGPGFSFAKRDAFLRAAAAALTSAAAHQGHGGGPVKTLSIHVEARSYFTTRMFMSLRGKHDLVAAVLAHPEARQVKDLRVSADHSRQAATVSGEHEAILYRLNVSSLPHEALRVLHVVRGELATTTSSSPAVFPSTSGCVAAVVIFPRLTELRLQGCKALLGDLQTVIDAALQLDALHMENTSFFTTTTMGVTAGFNKCLHSPTITVLVLEDCRWIGWEEGERVLDMPKLLYFRHDSSSRFTRVCNNFEHRKPKRQCMRDVTSID